MREDRLTIDWHTADGRTIRIGSIRVVENYGVKTVVAPPASGDKQLRSDIARLLLQWVEDTMNIRELA